MEHRPPAHEGLFGNSLALPHTVPHTDFCKNIVGFCRVCLQLPADVSHVYPEDLVVVIICVRPPDVVYNVIISEDAAAVFGQQGDQLVFDLGQMDLLTF